MPYVRFSLMRPKPGDDAPARELIDTLIAYYRQQPGHLSRMWLELSDSGGFSGRMGLWASEADANAAAQQEHDLVLRAQLGSVVTEHSEYAFEGVE